MHGRHFNPHLSPANGNQDETDHDHDLNLDLSLSQPLPPSLPTPNLARASSPSSSPNPIMVLFPSSSSSTLNSNPITPLFPSSSASTLNSNPITALFPSSSSSALNSNPMSSSSNPTTTVVSRSPSRSPSPTANPTAPTRWRRQLLPPGKTETIPAPYPWAKDRRAIICSMKTLSRNGIFKIVGKMKCKYCEKESEIEYDLVEKFREVERFIVSNEYEMYHRAPEVWKNLRQGNCNECNRENCVRPVIQKKRDINWLFLFLGQMVGFCSLGQLKYFCKHTRNHQTGARNRLLYIVYLTLWR